LNETMIPDLAEVGYYEQLVLYFLEKLHSSGKRFVNLQTIVTGTGLNYNSLRNKIDALVSLELAFSTKRGRERVVLITDKGKHAIDEWKKTSIGKELFDELDKKLATLEKDHK